MSKEIKKMNKKIYLIFIILLVCGAVSADINWDDTIHYFTPGAKFAIGFEHTEHGLTYNCFEVTVQNMQDSSDTFNPLLILNETDAEISKLNTIFYIEKKVDKIVNDYSYEKICNNYTIEVHNSTFDGFQNIKNCTEIKTLIGNHTETSKSWIEKPLFNKQETKSELSSQYEEINIQKNGNEKDTVKLKYCIYNLPIENNGKWGNAGTIYMKAGDDVYYDKTHSSWWSTTCNIRYPITLTESTGIARGGTGSTVPDGDWINITLPSDIGNFWYITSNITANGSETEITSAVFHSDMANNDQIGFTINVTADYNGVGAFLYNCSTNSSYDSLINNYGTYDVENGQFNITVTAGNMTVNFSWIDSPVQAITFDSPNIAIPTSDKGIGFSIGVGNLNDDWTSYDIHGGDTTCRDIYPSNPMIRRYECAEVETSGFITWECYGGLSRCRWLNMSGMTADSISWRSGVVAWMVKARQANGTLQTTVYMNATGYVQLNFSSDPYASYFMFNESSINQTSWDFETLGGAGLNTLTYLGRLDAPSTNTLGLNTTGLRNVWHGVTVNSDGNANETYLAAMNPIGFSVGSQESSNAAPIIQWVNVTAGTSYTNDTLKCTFNVSDTDLTDEVYFNVTWFREDIDVSSQYFYQYGNATNHTGGNVTTNVSGWLPTTNSSKSQNFTCQVYVTDGTDTAVKNSSTVIVQNLKPLIPDLNYPANGTSFKILPILDWANTTDEDKETLYYVVEVDNDKDFTDDAITYHNITVEFKNSTSAMNITVNGTYYWRIISYDNSSLNSTASNVSEFIYQTNRKPAISTVNISTKNAGNFSNENILFNYTYSDADSDSEVYTEIEWFKDGVNQSKLINDTYIYFGNTTRGDNWTVGVRSFDGTIWSSWINSTDLIIKNSIPRILTVNITTSNNNNYTTQNILFNYTFSDNDTSVEDYTEIEWFKDSVEQTALKNDSYVSETNTAVGENWTVGVRAYDGVVWSSWVNSTDLIILDAPRFVPSGGGGGIITKAIKRLTVVNTTYSKEWKVNSTETIYILTYCEGEPCGDIDFTFEFSPEPDGNFELENLEEYSIGVHKAEFNVLEGTKLKDYKLSIMATKQGFSVSDKIEFRAVKPLIEMFPFRTLIVSDFFTDNLKNFYIENKQLFWIIGIILATIIIAVIILLLELIVNGNKKLFRK